MPSRPDGVVTQSRIDQLSAIRGHLIPDGFTEDPLPGRDRVAELSPKQFYMVMQGYACGNGACLAWFDMVMVRCPACGQPCGPENLAKDPPPLWAEHRRAREEGPSTRPLPRGRVSPEAALARIAGSPDVEHTSLSKLKKRRG